jgi:hypothetical protein
VIVLPFAVQRRASFNIGLFSKDTSDASSRYPAFCCNLKDGARNAFTLEVRIFCSCRDRKNQSTADGSYYQEENSTHGSFTIGSYSTHVNRTSEFRQDGGAGADIVGERDLLARPARKLLADMLDHFRLLRGATVLGTEVIRYGI